jgi:hypothetical protein
MALTKQGEILGFTTDIYAKITGVDVRESGSNDDGKLYTVSVVINYYTDETKQYDYRQEVESFKDIPVSELTVAGLYDLLKTRLTDWVDA